MDDYWNIPAYIIIILSFMGSCFIIFCYTRVIYLYGSLVKRAYLEVVYCISIADFLLTLNFCFPFFMDFVISVPMLETYHEDGWPSYAYFVIPFGFFCGAASWLWLAFLPDALCWTVFEPSPIPIQKIRGLHIVWFYAALYAFLQTTIIFIVSPDNALLTRAILVDLLCVVIITTAATKYRRFYKKAMALTRDKDSRRRFADGLLRRALLYMLPYTIMWIPTYIMTTLCAIDTPILSITRCDDVVIRIFNLLNGLQGFAHACVFLREEKVRQFLIQGLVEQKNASLNKLLATETSGPQTDYQKLDGRFDRFDKSLKDPFANAMNSLQRAPETEAEVPRSESDLGVTQYGGSYSSTPGDEEYI